MSLPTGNQNWREPSTEMDFNRELERFEREFIEGALQRFGGNVSETARRANIPHRTLRRKIEQYAINPEVYK